ncbi:MAG: HAD family phosphatase [Pseudomonadota bacterium]
MAIVFDLGAVVFRWRPEVLLSSVLPQRASTPADAAPLVDAFFQAYTGDWGEFDRGTIGVPELVQRIAARTGLAPQEVEQVVWAVPQELQPLPQTVRLIERLKADGHALYFLSNMPLPYAQHLETANPFYDWFRDGVFSSRVKLIKPDPAIFELARERLGLDPAQTLFIDDSPPNVRAAREAGWSALRFTSADALEADLVAGGWL